MKITKEKFIFFILILVSFFPLVLAVYWPSQKLHFIACNVGQGDSIFITKGFIQVLIDGGPTSRVLDCLSANMPFWDKKIEVIISTHQDKDHLSGLIDVVENYQVEKIISNSLFVNTAVFNQFYQDVLLKKIPVYSPQAGDIIKVGELKFKVLWPQQVKGDIAMWQPDNFYNKLTIVNELYKNSREKVLGQAVYKGKTNINSIVLHFQYKNFDAILTGDISSKQEKQIIKNNQFKDIEVLKVAHHASKYSSSSEFLNAVKPKIAIISVGKNPWGHPTKEVLKRLENIGAKIMRTDKEKINIAIKN